MDAPRFPKNCCPKCGLVRELYGCTQEVCQTPPEALKRNVENLEYRDRQRRSLERLVKQWSQPVATRKETGRLEGAGENPGSTICQSPEAALQWLLMFAQEDLSTLSSATKKARCHQAAHLAAAGVIGLPSPLPVSLMRMPWGTKALPRLQRLVRSVLAAYLQDGRHRLVRLPGSMIIGPRATEIFLPAPGRGHAAIRRFRYRAAHVIAALTSKVAQCEGCPRFFVKTKANKRFCGDRCRARTQKRAERRTPPERYGKRGRPPRANLAKSSKET